MESENPMPPKIQRFKSKNVKLFLLAFLVALVPLTILVALTQQNLQQSAYMKDTVSFDRILQREQMLVADQMQLADQLDQQIQENDSGDTGTITKMNPLEKQNPAIWDIATNNIDIQREKSLMDQANNINILPGDTITDKLQKIAEKLNLIMEALKLKEKRLEKICLMLPKFKTGKGMPKPTIIPSGMPITITPIETTVTPAITPLATPTPTSAVTITATPTPTP